MLRTTFYKFAKSLTKKQSYFYFNQLPKYDPQKDYYQTLEVSKNATDSEIKQSYYRLAKAYHPDVSAGNQTKFKQISQAYSVLSDQKLKKEYNAARTFRGFSRKVGKRAKEGAFNPGEYQKQYQNLSQEERKEIYQGILRKMKKGFLYMLALLIFLPFFIRRNHKYFVVDSQGDLIPVQIETKDIRHMQNMYPNQYQYIPPQNYQPFNPYAQVAQNVSPRYYQQAPPYQPGTYQPGPYQSFSRGSQPPQ